jgi:hypothetical protein
MSVYPLNQRISNKTNRCTYYPDCCSKSVTDNGRGGRRWGGRFQLPVGGTGTRRRVKRFRNPTSLTPKHQSSDNPITGLVISN